MLASCAEIIEAERRLFSSGVDPEPFMDEAGRLCTEAISHFFPVPAHAEVFCGKGNNGGDALVVARLLKRAGWAVTLHCTHPSREMSPLSQKKLAEWEAEPASSARVSNRTILVDGLLGIGAKGNLRSEILEAARQINGLRQDRFATCFAIDIPSGLDADSGIPCPEAVIADFTLSITVPKIGFVADSAINHLGRIVEIPLDIPVEGADESRRFLFPSNLRPRLVRRNFDTHKGIAGRVTILAGSRGLTGAATLSALGASRSGAGLVTVCVPDSIYPLVVSQAPPEIMVKPIQSFSEVSDLKTDAFVIGPGLGTDLSPDLLEFLFEDPRPIIVDADALNALAKNPARLPTLPGRRLLTPHPGEMQRLTGLPPDADRARLATRFSEEWGVTLLLKGARTIIATDGQILEFNTTGHPGMASGGMGDVLTGVCAALVAGGHSLHDAACLGSWLLGRAAELTVNHRQIAAESISAPMVAESLGAALLALQTPGSP